MKIINTTDHRFPRMCNQRDSIQSIHQKEKNGKIEIRTNNIPYSCYKFVKDPVPNSLQNLVDFEFENRYSSNYCH